jgi:PAS domain S-box-containing protein
MVEISFKGVNFSKTLLDTVAALIVVMDKNAHIVGFNRACELLSGYSFEEVEGGSIDRFLLPEEMPGVEQVIRQLIQGENPVAFQNHWVTRSGEKRWIEWSNSVLRDEADGKVKYVLATGIDVTERNLKEKALQESEQRFFSLFHFSPSPTSIHSTADGSFLEVNPRFEQLTGYARQELIGKRPDILGIVRAELATTGLRDRAMIFGKPVSSEFQVRSKLGQDIFVLASLVRVNLNGKDCMIATLQDISERKAHEYRMQRINEELEHYAEERATALELQKERGNFLQDKLNKLLRVSPVVIISFKPEYPFLITFISENVETVFGYRADQLVNVPGVWQDLIDPDELANVSEIIPQILTGTCKTVEFHAFMPDGNACCLQMDFTLVFDAQHKPVEVQGTLQDITARRNYETDIRDREELYRSLAESAHDFIFVISREGMIEYVNSYASEAFQIKPEEMIGKPRGSFFPDDYASQQVFNLRKVFEEDCASYYENPIPFPTGARWLGTRLVPLHDQAGRVRAVMGVARDITERIRAEQDLQLALQKERELNELRKNFVSMITHQVGTPLSTILSSAEMLEHYSDRWSDEHRQKHLTRIIESTKRVDAMVRDILELGRVESNTLVSEPSAVDLVDVCQNVIDIFLQADHGRHHIHFSAPGHSILCWIDEQLIQQTLENLMSNAIKYSPDETFVELSLMLEDQKVVMKVIDQGAGIPAADISQVGTPFYRGKNVARISGTGLGLTLVKRTIKMFGGEMYISSEENKGTEVELRFPLRTPLLPIKENGD